MLSGITVTGTAKSQDATQCLQDLLQASKGAERLISACFELGILEGEPFQDIWDQLDRAIDQAQDALRMIH
jgi:hypothetical protein